MAAGGDEAAILSKWGGAIIAAIASGFTALIAWMGGRIVKKHDDEIASIKGSLKKLEADMSAINQKLPENYTPLERFETFEGRTRESIIALHSKIEGSEQRLAQKIDAGNRDIMAILTRRRT